VEVHPFIKEGVINIFPETDVFEKKNKCFGKIFIQTVDLEYEGEGEEGSIHETQQGIR
jgi:hypothetical protein